MIYDWGGHGERWSEYRDAGLTHGMSEEDAENYADAQIQEDLADGVAYRKIRGKYE